MGFPGDPGESWSPKEVIRRIPATEKTATAVTERYSDELLDRLFVFESPRS
jgi:hypothetical protein